jgi:glycosyltransferase involved in cell wall biosynthesis
MRIGLISADFHPNVGGVAAHVIELGKACAADGHEVHVCTLPIGDETQSTASWQGMHVHRPLLLRGRPFYTWMLRLWLKAFLKRTKLDVLHVHGLRPLEATRYLGPPVIFTNHTSGFLQRMEKGPRAQRRVAGRFSHLAAVIAPSEELAEATRRLNIPCDVHLISNGVDPQRFCPGPRSLRQQWGIADDETVVLLARRLVEKNGVRVFAEAARHFHRPGVRIVIAGDGPERAEMEQILQRDGCHDAVLFLGSVPNPQMPDVYRAADISVLPSFLEATSITGLESMATALPLVGTRVGGIPTIVDEGRTGLLVPAGDPPRLGDAIGRLIDHPDARRSMGEAARARVLSDFSWAALARRTVDIYEQALRQKAKAV